MPELEHAQLIPVTGNSDTPDLDGAITVQFNPTSLKVALTNSLKANENEGSDRAAQFVDKSSSTLNVELLFDTSVAGTDVREQTKAIALKFLKPEGEGEQMTAPNRCLFQWGAFEFVGLLASLNENLDFFSPEGTPLRASVSLRLNEDRFQFRSRAAQRAERDTPSFGAPAGTGQDAKPVHQANAASGADPKEWRRTALLNQIENPRLPQGGPLAVPSAAQPVQTLADTLSDSQPAAELLRTAAGTLGPVDAGSLGFD